MRLLFRIYAKPAAQLALVLSFLLTAAIPLLAGDVSGALYRADVVVTNTSYTATRVSVPFTLNTQALIDGYYLESDFSNVALQTAAGTDIPFMPAVGSGDQWMMYAGQVNQNSSQNYVLYTGGPGMGSSIYYFPDDGGMATLDSASLELGNNFGVEWGGYIDTSSGSDKNLAYKEDAFSTYISASGSITSEFPVPESWVSPNGHNDPDSIWINETNAYDENTGTYAEVSFTTNSPEWSGFLELTVASITTTKIQYYVSQTDPTYVTQIDVDVYRDGGWVDVFQGTPTWNVWEEKTFASGVVTQARIRFYKIDTGGQGYGSKKGRLHEFDFNNPSRTVSVTATGISSGEHTVKITADTTDLKIYIDDVEEDSAVLGGASVLDNSNGWSFLTNYSMPYMGYHKITINGTLRQHIIWENSATFTDQSGNGHDATPTFRATTTDSDVTAVVKNFNAVTHAAFSSGTDDEIPEMVLAPEESIDLHRRMENTDQLPGGEWVNNFMDDNGWPRELFWFTFVFGIAVLFTNVAFRFTKDLFPTALAPAIWVVLFASAGVVPWAALWPCAVVSIGEIIRRRVVAIG